jgi:uncharacterized protein YcbK (DUF882 family)
MGNRVKYFKIEEFDCQETGENHMDPDFLERIELLRHRCGFPFHITSGYRSKDHSLESKKERPGMHSRGRAADIAVKSGYERHKIVKEAMNLGFNGIGVADSFVHVDTRKSPVIWVY